MQKPVELVARAIVNSSNRGEAVLDAFGGSGTTLITCEKTGRKARLIELDSKYVGTAVIRWQKFSGRAAALENDGRPFAEIAVERALPSRE